MNDGKVFGFVPGKYSIHRRFVGGCDLVQGLALADLMNDFLGGRRRVGRRARGCRYNRLRDGQALADRQPRRGQMVRGLQLFDGRVIPGCNLCERVA